MCKWCDTLKCPNWISADWKSNRVTVDGIIADVLSWVDLNNESSINDAKKAVKKFVKEAWLNPCMTCLQVDLAIEQMKTALSWNLAVA